MKKTFTIIMLLLWCQGYLCALDGTKSGKITDALNIRGALGTYGNPPRLESGEVNMRRLISELKDIHADTYHWLILKPNDWDELKHFLPLARKAHLT
jgi:hypothetical protein